MSTALARSSAPKALRWSEVERGFHVAYRGDAFAGFVETTPDGSFVAFDEFSSPIGRYGTLAHARSSLSTTTSPGNDRRRRRMQRARRAVAALAGGAAGALLLTAGVLAPYL
ncbi:hypothetical protein ACTU3I_11130 [Microbacterium sp. RD1]|uniref:hypothetical protein n=1 Tax=Microbacterium sp. RD1 TaxID=3457313 RepID=UPI003FA528E5